MRMHLCGLWVLTTAATLLVTTSARADDDYSKAFDGTVRQRMVIQAGLANARTYGAVAAVNHVLMPNGTLDATRIGGEFNWIWGAAKVPSMINGQYILQTIDMTAGNFAASYCSKGSGFRFCGFYAGAMTSIIAPKNGERFNDNLFLGIAGRAVGTLAPLAVLAGGSDFHKGMTTLSASAILGVNFKSEWVSGRVGYLGASGDRGFYGDINYEPVKAFITAALTEQFQEASMLVAGIRNLGQEIKDAPGILSAYVRDMRMVSPQTSDIADDYKLPKLKDQLGSFQFLTAHIDTSNIAKHLGVQAAYTLKPTPQIYNLDAILHTEGFSKGAIGKGVGAAIGGGLVQLPELPTYGLRSSKNIHFFAELSGSAGGLVFAYRVNVNEPDILTTFPFARNAWGFYFLLSVGGKALSGR